MKTLLIASCIALFGACGPRTQDTISGQENTPTREWQLKELTIDATNIYPEGQDDMRGIPFTEAMTLKFKPQSIDEFYGPETAYYLVDSIAASAQGSVFLIGKSDPNESSAWLVIYNTGMHVEHQLEVYYENAEGNFYLHSEIRDNIVIATGENITPEPEPVSRFRIEGLRWQLIQ